MAVMLVLCAFAQQVWAAEDITYFAENQGLVCSDGWSRSWHSGAMGDYHQTSSTLGATASFDFNGTGVRWIATVDPRYGEAQVTLLNLDLPEEDPTRKVDETTIDLYNPVTLNQQLVYQKSHLVTGNYRLLIMPLASNRFGTGTNHTVSVDTIGVLNTDGLTLPQAPINPWGVAGNQRAELYWQASPSSDVEAYNVYRSTSLGSGYVKINSWPIMGPTHYTDTTVQNGQVYYYLVRAQDTWGNQSEVALDVNELPVDAVTIQPLMPQGTYEENQAGPGWSRADDGSAHWTRPWSSGASGDYLHTTSTVGAKVEFWFHGDSFQWIGTKSTNGGTAKVTIDGVEAAEPVSLQADGTIHQQTLLEQTWVQAGLHHVVIEVLTGSVNVDKVVIGAPVIARQRVEESNLAVEIRGIWEPWSRNEHSGGRVWQSKTAGAVMQYDFYGTGIEVVAYKNSNRGIAKITLDQQAPVYVDLYSPSDAWKQKVYKWHDSQGIARKHRITIEVLNQRSSSSGDTWVTIDGFDVFNPVEATPDAPLNLTAQAGDGGINLSWQAPGDEVIGYQVYRSHGLIDDGKISLGLVRETSFTDRELQVGSAAGSGTEYTYYVTAIGCLGQESLASTESATPSPLVHTEVENATGVATVYQDDSADILHAGWSRNWRSGDSDSYHLGSSTEGTTASLTFTGTGIKWYTKRTTNQGQAEVWIDGRLEQVIDLYGNDSASTLVYQRSHLPRGEHTFMVKVRAMPHNRQYVSIDYLKVLDIIDEAAPLSPANVQTRKDNTFIEIKWDKNTEDDINGYRIYRSTRMDGDYQAVATYPPNPKYNDTADAWQYRDVGLQNGTTYYYLVTAIDEVGNQSQPGTVKVEVPAALPGKYEEDNPGMVHDAGWSRGWIGGESSGGHHLRSTGNGDIASFTFEGTGIKWYATADTNGGLAEVYIDGVSQGTVDLRRSSRIYQHLAWQNFTALPFAVHTIEIRNVSTTNNNVVTIDYFDVKHSDDTTPPSAPANLQAFSGNNHIELRWSMVLDEDLAGYRIYRREVWEVGEDAFALANPDLVMGSSSWTDTGVVNGKTYEYYVVAVDDAVNQSGASNHVTIQPLMPQGTYEENQAGPGWSRADDGSAHWTRPWSSGASGDYLHTTSTVGAKVEFWFHGDSFQWIGTKSTNGGTAKVTIDGVEAAEPVSLQADGTIHQQTLLEQTWVQAGLHHVVIEVLTGSVNVDKVVIGAPVIARQRVEESNLAVEIRGIWEPWSRNEHSGGRVWQSKTAGAVMQYDFYGTGIEVVAYKNSNRGIAKITLDQQAPVYVDLYSPSDAWKQKVYKWHDSQGIARKHRITIEVLNQRSSSSGDTWVTIDGFDVFNPVEATPDAPLNLTAQAGDGGINLSWQAPGDEVIGYQVYRSHGLIDDGKISLGLVRETSFTDRELQVGSAAGSGTEYTYYVTAIGCLGQESLASTESATPSPLVHTEVENATGVATVYQDDSADILHAGWSRNWRSGDSDSYHLGSSTEGTTASLTFTGTGIKWYTKRTTNQGQAEVWIDGRLEQVIDLYGNDSASTLVYQRSHLPRGEHTFMVKVRAMPHNRQYVSIDYLKVLDIIDEAAPLSPANVQTRKDNTFIEIKWDKNTEDDINGYRIYRSTRMDGDYQAVATYPPNPKYNDTADAWQYRDVGLQNGTTYYYLVTAIDEVGNQSQPGTVKVEVPAALPGKYEEDNPGMVHDAGWSRGWIGGESSGGHHLRSTGNGDIASFTFEGTGIKWYATADTNGGLAEVYIDGVSQGTVDLRRSSRIYQHLAWQNFTALPFAVHTIEIRNVSTTNNNVVTIDYFDITAVVDTEPPLPPAGLVVWSDGNSNLLQWLWSEEADIYGYYVYRDNDCLTPDPLIYGSTYRDDAPVEGANYSVVARDQAGNLSAACQPVAATMPDEAQTEVNENSKAIAYLGSWSEENNASFLGGRAVHTSHPVVYRWFGTGIDWVSALGPGRGSALVSINDGPAVRVDLYRPTNAYQQTVFRARGVSSEPAMHTVRVWSVGKHLHSSSTHINVDAFRVVGAHTPPPPAPTHVEALLNVDQSKVQITWESVTDPDIVGYNVYYRTEGFMEFSLANAAGPVQSGFEHTGLNLAANRYYYKVKSVDALGQESGFSAEANANISAVLSAKRYEAHLAETVIVDGSQSWSIDMPITYSWKIGDEAFSAPSETASTLGVAFQEAGEYTVTLLVTDVYARTAEASAIIDVSDRRGPAVVSSTPEDGATSVPITQELTVTFDEPILSGTGFDSMTLQAGDAAPITVTGTIMDTSLTLTITEALSYGTSYRLTLPASAVKDAAANPSQELVLTFTTEDEPDTTGPAVVGVSPQNAVQGVADVAKRPAISVTFSEPLLAEDGAAVTVTGGEQTLVCTFTVTDNVLNVALNEDLVHNAKYTVTIPAGCVKDLTGNVFPADYQFSFWTDLDPPSWPADAQLTATDLMWYRFWLHWTPAVDSVGVKAYKVYADGNYVGTTVPADQSSCLMGSWIGESAIYTLRAVDAAGNESLDGPAVQVTMPEADTDTPTLVSQSHVSEVTGVPIDDYFVFSFSEEIVEGDWISWAGVSLYPADIHGRIGDLQDIDVWIEGNSLMIRPVQSLAFGQYYKLIVRSKSVADLWWKANKVMGYYDQLDGHLYEHDIVIYFTTIEQVQPVADPGGPYVIQYGQSLVMDASASTAQVAIDSYYWDLDGDGALDITSSDPTVTVNWNTLQSYGFQVADPLTQLPANVIKLQVKDIWGSQSVSAAADLVILAGEPVANNDSYQIEEGQTLEVTGPGLLENDQIYDCAVKVEVTSGPVRGTVTVADDGSFSYTPSAGFSGTDSFTYRITLGGLADDAVVTVTVIGNQAPVANAGGPYVVYQGEELLLDASGSIDPDQDALSYKWDLDGDGTYELSSAAATYTVSWDTLSAYNFPLADPDTRLPKQTIGVQVQDARGATGVAQATLTLLSRVPVAVDDQYSTPSEEVLSISAPGVLANDKDADTDKAALTVSLVSGPTSGTLQLSSDGSFTYTPAAGFSGTDSFTYAVSDGTYADTGEVTITVQPDDNQAPVADAGGPYVLQWCTNLELDGSASADPDVGDSIVSWQWDLNGDGVYDDASGQTATVEWETLLSLLATPAHSDNGSPVYYISVRVMDSNGCAHTETTSLKLLRKLGDFNGDNIVDLLDLASVALDYGWTGNVYHPADMNGDGITDIFDLVIVARNLTL